MQVTRKIFLIDLLDLHLKNYSNTTFFVEKPTFYCLKKNINSSEFASKTLP